MATSAFEEAWLGKCRQNREPPLTNLNRLFFENIEKLSTVEKFEVNFKNCVNNIERVHLFSKYFPISEEFLSFFRPNTSDYEKSEKLSTKFREHGNIYFREKNFNEALRGYNLALAFAPIGSEELGLAYANRSAVFLELNQLQHFKQCLQDIGFARINGHPHKLREKLEKRRLKCSKKIENEEMLDSVGLNDTTISKKIQAIEDYKENILFKIQNPNLMMSVAENFIQIAIHPTRGRELVATGDIPPGSTLIVEIPFVQILKNVLQWDLSHCHNCLRSISGGIPCCGCVFAFYCTEECREASIQFHQYECPCWIYLRLNQTPRFVLLTLRLISKLGPINISRLYKNFKELTETKEVYNSNSYSTIYYLVSHEDVQESIDHFSNVLQSLILLTLLEKTTPFFKQLETKVRECDSFRPWFTSLILHHLQNLPCNSLSLDELNSCAGIDGIVLNAQNIRKAQLDQYASGVYGTISLINHSCDPNVTRLTDASNHGRMCIVSLKRLKAGDTLYTSYTKSFQDPLEERRKYLAGNYFFHCACQPCIENWPPLSTLLCSPSYQQPKFRCPKCSNPLGKSGRCSSCKNKTSEQKLLAKYEKKVEGFFKSYDLLLQNEPLDAIQKVGPVLEYFQTEVVAPFGKTYMAQDTLKRALDVIVYFQNVITSSRKRNQPSLPNNLEIK